MSIIEQIADRPASLSDVADQLGVHKSTALRLLHTLERAGFARRGSTGHYMIGSRLIGIAYKALDSLDLREIARPHLTRINREYGHTIHLATLLDDEIVYIDKYEGHTSVRMYSRIGKVASPYASGVGKAILAFQSDSAVERLLPPAPLLRHTDKTISDVSALRAELERIREAGFARDDGEFEDIIVCIAAPIRSADGAVESAFSISTPRMLMPLNELDELVPELLSTAEAISRDYGWSDR